MGCDIIVSIAAKFTLSQTSHHTKIKHSYMCGSEWSMATLQHFQANKPHIHSPQLTTIQGHRLVHTTPERVCTSTVEWLTISNVPPPQACLSCFVMESTSCWNLLPSATERATDHILPRAREQLSAAAGHSRDQSAQGEGLYSD